jgi:hypothetical protein
MVLTKFGTGVMLAIAGICLAGLPAAAATIDTITLTNAPSSDTFTIDDSQATPVELCNFCVFTDDTPWDLYITDPNGDGKVLDHVYSPGFGGPGTEFDALYFSTDTAGSSDASLGAACPNAGECIEETPGGITDLTALFNSLGVSDIGGIGGLTVQSYDSVAPEPGTLALFGLGIAGFGFVKLRRRA